MAEAEQGVNLDVNEETLDLPASLFKKKTGYSFDFGGSVLKIAYATHAGDVVRLHFVSFGREEKEVAFRFLKARCGDSMGPGEEVITCGIGGNQYCDEFSQLMNVRVNNTSEFKCLLGGFQFLANNLPFEQFVHPEDMAATEEARRLTLEYRKILQSFNTSSNKFQIWPNDGELPDRSTKVEYPLLLMSGGSAAFLLLVEENGKYTICEFTPTSGLTMYGLASLLTDVKNFADLEELAERGTSGNVDVLIHSLELEENDDVYDSFKGFNRPAFRFGKAAWKEKSDFKREDMASAVIGLLADNMCLTCHSAAMLTGVRQIFFVGGLNTSCKIFRHMLTKEMEYKRQCNFKGVHTDFMFVRLGIFLSALGGLLATLGFEQESS